MSTEFTYTKNSGKGQSNRLEQQITLSNPVEESVISRNSGSDSVQMKCAECAAEEEKLQMKLESYQVRADGLANGDGKAASEVQTKLEIGRPDDKFEKEADAIADQVMRIPDPPNHFQMKSDKAPDISMKCTDCEEEEKLQMKPSIQRSANGNTQYVSNGVGQRLNSTKGGGQSLPSHLGQEMSSKIGADFSHVKLHTDSSAIQMNRELGAKAFTHGNDIYFNSGQYNPSSSKGKHLLAHELTHVVQQNHAQDVIRRDPLDTGSFEDTGDLEYPICGPDVSSALMTVAERARQHFRSLSDDEKKESCYSLIHLGPAAAYAWDINELQYKGIGWIVDYQPDAGIGGQPQGKKGIPRCEESVTVGEACYLPNTVNYYIYGVMFKECYDFLNNLPETVPKTQSEPVEPIPQSNDNEEPSGTQVRGADHPIPVSTQDYIKEHTGMIFVKTSSLGSDLLFLAMQGESHYDFIKNVMQQLYAVSRDNVAWAFFASAGDSALEEIASTQSGYDLIMYMWEIMANSTIPSPGEIKQRWRLYWLISKPSTGEESELDTSNNIEDISDTGDFQDTGSLEEGCMFAGESPELLSKEDAKRFSEENMVCIIQYYKDMMYGGARAEQSIAWALAGYGGSDGSSIPGDSGLLECEPSDTPYDGPDFTLIWSPHLSE